MKGKRVNLAMGWINHREGLLPAGLSQFLYYVIIAWRFLYSVIMALSCCVLCHKGMDI